MWAVPKNQRRARTSQSTRSPRAPSSCRKSKLPARIDSRRNSLHQIQLGATSLSRLLFRPSSSLHCENELFPLFKSLKTTSRFFKFWAEQFEKISLFFIFAHISLSISIYFFRSSTFLISLIITFFFNISSRKSSFIIFALNFQQIKTNAFFFLSTAHFFSFQQVPKSFGRSRNLRIKNTLNSSFSAKLIFKVRCK